MVFGGKNSRRSLSREKNKIDKRGKKKKKKKTNRLVGTGAKRKEGETTSS